MDLAGVNTTITSAVLPGAIGVVGYCTDMHSQLGMALLMLTGSFDLFLT